ncbi:hypothetical protein PPERSA_10147 [Pseudocohnilembus persalinus]|uniref:RyR/IP3R Homology associated domain-containing protein n=1 Tax=Pseudocohnilembus persalinus TaxID=266149 RepID=A0A0V0QLL8_PSEPJ|nr:hypothetical protein PPERSA_10147 [Pseudocohnilembus persalinus]|eukprot:KRX03066.1 hypothetical protein PPERSA_10147 [Pseudocohnilembus persalinus]
MNQIQNKEPYLKIQEFPLEDFFDQFSVQNYQEINAQELKDKLLQVLYIDCYPQISYFNSNQPIYVDKIQNKNLNDKQQSEILVSNNLDPFLEELEKKQHKRQDTNSKLLQDFNSLNKIGESPFSKEQNVEDQQQKKLIQQKNVDILDFENENQQKQIELVQQENDQNNKLSKKDLNDSFDNSEDYQSYANSPNIQSKRSLQQSKSQRNSVIFSNFLQKQIFQVDSPDLLQGLQDIKVKNQQEQKIKEKKSKLFAKKLRQQQIIEEKYFVKNLENKQKTKKMQEVFSQYNLDIIITKFLENNFQNILTNDPFIEPIYKQAFQFLHLFVEENQENQRRLYQEIDFYIQFFEKNIMIDFGQFMLLRKIFQDNYDLKLKITEKLLKAFIYSPIISELEIEKHKEFLYEAMTFKGEIIQQNYDKFDKFLPTTSFLFRKKHDNLFLTFVSQKYSLSKLSLYGLRATRRVCESQSVLQELKEKLSLNSIFSFMNKQSFSDEDKLWFEDNLIQDKVLKKIQIRQELYEMINLIYDKQDVKFKDVYTSQPMNQSAIMTLKIVNMFREVITPFQTILQQGSNKIEFVSEFLDFVKYNQGIQETVTSQQINNLQTYLNKQGFWLNTQQILEKSQKELTQMAINYNQRQQIIIKNTPLCYQFPSLNLFIIQLKFISACVASENSDFQNLFRQQKNLVYQTNILHVLTKTFIALSEQYVQNQNQIYDKKIIFSLSEHEFKQLLAVLDTIKMLIYGGNEENQNFLLQSQFLKWAQYYLKIGNINLQDLLQYTDLKNQQGKTVQKLKLLKIKNLYEEDEVNKKFVTDLKNKEEIQLFSTFEEVSKTYKKNKFNLLYINVIKNRCLEIVNILLDSSPNNNHVIFRMMNVNVLENIIRHNYEMFFFICQKTGYYEFLCFTALNCRIEIIVNGKSEELFFILPPQVKTLDNEQKSHIQRKIDRSSLQSKHLSIIKHAKLFDLKLIFATQFIEKLETNKTLKLISQHEFLIRQIIFIIILIEAFILMGVKFSQKLELSSESLVTLFIFDGSFYTS